MSELHGESNGSWQSRPLWLEEADAQATNPGPQPRLQGRQEADVCIVGGGFLGLWTAILLKQRSPELAVTIVESTRCGDAASGRNGGMALSWWPKIETLIEKFGETEGYRLARLSGENVADLGRRCEELGVDAEYRMGGWLWTSTSAAQDGAWEKCLQLSTAKGDQPFERLDRAEIERRTGSPAHRGGVFEAGSAIVHPGKLVRGLRRAALDLGVTIYESSPAEKIDMEAITVSGTEGSVAARHIVIATNVWTAQLNRYLGRAVVPLSSDVVATEPVPELLEEIGWTGGESISNSRLMVAYYRTTDSGRIVFGRGGGTMSWGIDIGPEFDYSAERTRLALATLRRLIPAARDVKITHAWAGAVDRGRDGLPFVGGLGREGRVSYGLGFSGNGVAATLFVAKALAGRILDQADEYTEAAICNGRRGIFPPEPLRFLVGKLVHAAVKRKEDREDEGLSVGRLNRRIAALAPSGYFKPSPPGSD